MPTDKNYASGLWERERKFPDGGQIINLSGKFDDFTRWLSGICDGQGNFRLTISPRRQVSDKGISHSVYQDTYQPKERTDASAEYRRPSAPTTESINVSTKEDTQEGLPF